MKAISIIALVAMAVFINSCTKDSGPIVILPPPPPLPLPNDTVSFKNDMMVIMQVKCWFCHPPSGHLDLGFDSAYSNLVNRPSFGYVPDMRVVPYDTASSVLYQKLMGNPDFGLQMPPGNYAELDTAEKNIFTKWILQGAMNN